MFGWMKLFPELEASGEPHGPLFRDLVDMDFKLSKSYRDDTDGNSGSMYYCFYHLLSVRPIEKISDSSHISALLP